ncbi:MAG: plastocyanin/azurin family copper-binding protein [Myxococcales bacterium]
MTLARTLFIGSLAVAFAACSSGGGADGGTSSGGASGGSNGGSGGTVTVTISNFQYSPDPVTVAAGSTITFVNNDGHPHTATSEAAAKSYTNGHAPNGFSFDTGQIAANGGSATVTVPASVASGTSQPYYCTNHKGSMTNPDPVIKIQ